MKRSKENRGKVWETEIEREMEETIRTVIIGVIEVGEIAETEKERGGIDISVISIESNI